MVHKCPHTWWGSQKKLQNYYRGGWWAKKDTPWWADQQIQYTFWQGDSWAIFDHKTTSHQEQFIRGVFKDLADNNSSSERGSWANDVSRRVLIQGQIIAKNILRDLKENKDDMKKTSRKFCMKLKCQ